jgi:hypothetical protein
MKNFKTTILGTLISVGGGLALVDDPIISMIGKIIALIGPALLGLVAKDSNVTGGSVKQ